MFLQNIKFILFFTCFFAFFTLVQRESPLIIESETLRAILKNSKKGIEGYAATDEKRIH